MRTFLVTCTTSNSTFIKSYEIILENEKANPVVFTNKINSMIHPSYVKQVVSWSLIEE